MDGGLTRDANPDRERAASAEEWPSVSVIMPILNEERYLAEAVRRVLAQEYDGELEVVLAIGPSQDATAEVAQGLSAADPRVRVVDNPSGRTPDGLNAALHAARHEVIVRVDGHAELSDGYIRTAVTELERTGAVNVGGIMDAQGTTSFERAVACAMKSPLGVGNARFHCGGGEGEAETVYLGVFRRQTLLEAGGYDTHFTRAQDWELNHRLRQSGGRIWFTPELKVTYRPRPTVNRLSRQYFEYGRWRRVVSARHATINPRYLAPPAMVVGTAAATVAGLRRPALLAIPAAYLTAVAAGGIAISKGQKTSTRALVPVALATMHWSWGVGFLTSPRRLRRPAQEKSQA
ncbi:putative glycosyltransferase [Austwickia chelonae NBRC 105200]|uniref:Putative glycosyltransferase n=1 Tax=Austwickia chelonae NBRC 105200 TaxID=1184607 RepID=K6UKX0_9MICO|nr:putative glycosyltransferase [Austwickia chelonae NBRC 105200]